VAQSAKRPPPEAVRPAASIATSVAVAEHAAMMKKLGFRD